MVKSISENTEVTAKSRNRYIHNGVYIRCHSNPILYNGNTYTWQNGRQLASISNDQLTQSLGEVFNVNKVTTTLSGDFNGDSQKDIAVLYNYGNGQIKIIVWLGTGSSFQEGQVWYDSGINGLNMTLVQDRIVAGDFSGDGKTDIAILYDCGNAQVQTYVFLSNGTTFTKQLWHDSGAGNINASCLTGRVVAGDFDGDGKCDVAGLYDYGNADTSVVVWKSTGTQFNVGVWYRTGVGSANATAFTGRVTAGDFNGDGKDDILGIYEYGDGTLKAFTSMSQTTSFSGFQERYNLEKIYTAAQITGKIANTDFNDDGKSDMGLIVNNSIYVFNSTGTVFNAPINWRNTGNGIVYKYNDVNVRTEKIVNGLSTKYYIERKQSNL